MLCSHGFQSALSPSMNFFYWPVLSLRPQVQPLFYQLMDELQHDILEQTEPFQSSVAEQPAASHHLDKQGENFAVTLEAAGFSPEELMSVRLVGRKLRVGGKTEEKQEDGNGSSSYRLQEFIQELDVPEGLDPEAVTCCLSPDGKLHIQAARAPRVEEAERESTVQRSWEEKTQQSVCSQEEHTQQRQDDTH